MLVPGNDDGEVIAGGKGEPTPDDGSAHGSSRAPLRRTAIAP